MNDLNLPFDSNRYGSLPSIKNVVSDGTSDSPNSSKHVTFSERSIRRSHSDTELSELSARCHRKVTTIGEQLPISFVRKPTPYVVQDIQSLHILNTIYRCHLCSALLDLSDSTVVIICNNCHQTGNKKLKDFIIK